MQYLFIHQNFPGQFRHIAKSLADDPTNVVLGMGDEKNMRAQHFTHPNIQLFSHQPPTAPSGQTHHYIRTFEQHIRRGQNVIRALQPLMRKGLNPDVVVAHSGWGEAIFLRDIFPKAKIIEYCEFFYQSKGADLGFDQEWPTKPDDLFRIRIKNSTQLMSLPSCDLGISPTQWQKSTYPIEFQNKIQTIHEGIDTTRIKPNPDAFIKLGDVTFKSGDEILTFVARNLEPYRGFHVLMRVLPEVLRLRPNAHVLIVGGDDVSYGQRLPNGQTYKERFSQEFIELGGDSSRIHFLGKLPYESYLQVLQVSAVHAYWTYPFVLSWSMLEAMAAGCLVIGSRTAPVTEVIQDEKNGFLVDFFDESKWVKTLSSGLENRKSYEFIRNSARKTITEKYDLQKICLPKWLNLVS